MAEVFLAQTVGAEGFTRPVAIKRVLPAFSDDAQFAAMFINEAKLSARLTHPNVVQVLDFDRDRDGRLYLVMELVEGKDLSDVLEAGGPLPLPVVVHVTVEVLKGLAYAHELRDEHGRPLGIVHRDVSPHNALVSWDGAVKVSDFGIAKAMLGTSSRSGMIKGKPLYMAPEQVTSPDLLDHRADLFAVGVMLYEMLTGQRLYRGTTNEEVLTDIVQVAHGLRAMVAPSALRADLPPELSDVTMMLLAPHRDQRFASARAAIDALLATPCASPRGADLLAAELVARFPDQARARGARAANVLVAPPSAPTAAGTVAMGTPPAPATPATRPLRPVEVTPSPASMVEARGRRWVWVGGLAAVVVVAGVALTMLSRSDDPPSEPAAAPSEPAAAPSNDDSARRPDVAPSATPDVAPSATTTAPDAAPADAAPVAIDAGAAPDAAPEEPEPKTNKRGRRDRDRSRRTDDSTIHEIVIPGE